MQTCGAAAFEKRLWKILGRLIPMLFGFWQHLAEHLAEHLASIFIFHAFVTCYRLLPYKKYSEAGRFQSNGQLCRQILGNLRL